MSSHRLPRSRWTMERFIEETFGAKPLFEASKLIHETQALVEDPPKVKDAATRRRIGVLLARLHDAAQLHQWLEETDVIASLQTGKAKSPAALERQLRAGLLQLEGLLHDRLLRTITTRLKSRRR